MLICEECFGDGYIGGEVCRHCGGEGTVDVNWEPELIPGVNCMGEYDRD